LWTTKQGKREGKMTGLLVFLVLVAVIIIALSSRRKNRVKPYTDAGIALTYKLISSLNLTGWSQGIPVFTQIE
jgi:hypothetical protein